jgi:Cytosol aminopeptidase family, N-terminal domain
LDLRFTAPELHALDQISTEILIACVAEDERPAHGVAGLLDWRLAGSLSRLMHRGFFTGRLGEVLLVPSKPKLPFDKIVLFGIGPRADFDEDAFRVCLTHILETLKGLRARSAVAELPGRHFDAITPERAAELLFEAVGSSREHDVWTLAEPAEAQRAITRHLAQERRRGRQF